MIVAWVTKLLTSLKQFKALRGSDDGFFLLWKVLSSLAGNNTKNKFGDLSDEHGKHFDTVPSNGKNTVFHLISGKHTNNAY